MVLSEFYPFIMFESTYGGVWQQFSFWHSRREGVGRVRAWGGGGGGRVARSCQGGTGGGRQGLLTVAEIAFEVVSVVPEDLEALVFDLPARPAAGGKLGDIILVDRAIGGEAAAVGHLTVGVGDLDLEPVDWHGVGAVAQRHVVEPTAAIDRAVAAAPDGLTALRQLDACQVLAKGGLRLRLAGEEGMSAHRLDRGADRLAGVEIVATAKAVGGGG